MVGSGQARQGCLERDDLTATARCRIRIDAIHACRTSTGRSEADRADMRWWRA